MKCITPPRVGRRTVLGAQSVREVIVNKPILDQVNLVCGDVDASIAFYRRLGVEIAEDAIWRTATGAHHASASERSADRAVGLDFDSAVFAPHWNAGWKGRADLKGRIVVGFHVATRDDVDAIFRDMTGAGYRGLQEPWDAFWGARYAVLEDPDGIAVGLMSPISPEMRSPPPEV
jgi:catechol 2,3-dioxygenase-like lactoylglutathione lyase family enzyme